MEKKTETFEEYGIKIPYRRRNGNVKCVCPNCKTSGRTHPEDKSLSVNLDLGVWNCHYCGWSGGLKGYEGRRPERRKNYARPKPLEEHGLSQKLINYWSLRGISLDTLKKMHISEGMEFMPQVGKEMNTVQFPYYLEGELINVKYRTGDKKFKMVTGAELIPYNIDGIKDKDTAVIVEGECFDDKAQVLTTEGWKLFDELKEDDRVAQWEGGIITFAKPLAKIKKPYKGDLIEIANERRNYYSLTTPKHNLVTYRNGKFKKMHAEDIRSQISVPRTGFYDGPGLPYSDEYIRLLVAISADFTIRRKGDIYGCLKKRRKIDRIKWLLDKVGVRYSLNIDNRGYSSVFIHRGEIKDAFKEFPVEWISLVSARQAQIILEEIVLWDGNCVKGRTMKEYSTKLYHNAVWVQTLCHLGGMCSTICYRENEVGAWYKVTMLFKSTSTIKKEYKKGVPYNGFVYCCTMPAGTLLVRQNDIITVSGNCDALSFIEAGIDNVISVPNGANANLEWLDDFLEGWFDDKQTLYIATDNDEKGLQLRDELVRRFGAERCMIVEWSQGCKDANDQLKSFGTESLKNCITGAHEVKVGGIYNLPDYENELDVMWREGLQRGKTIGHENFDKLVSFETKRLMVVTGVPGCLDGDSAVLMSDGTTKPIRDVQVGDDVMALDKSYSLVPRPVVTKWDSGEKMCYKLTTDKGRTLIATGDHKILSFDGMKPLKELKVGEFIGAAGNYNLQHREILTHDQLALVAIWIAEGNKSQNTYIVSNGNPKIVELMQQICERNNLNFHHGAKYEYIISTRTPLKCDRVRYISSMSYYFRQKHGVDVETSTRMASEKYEKKMTEGVSVFNPMDIIKFLGLKGITTNSLFIPDEIKRMGKWSVRTFLNVLISCDGCISTQGIEYSSNSQQLCRDIQDLLARNGINATLRHKTVKYNGATRDHYVLNISHRSGVLDFAVRVGLVGHTEKLKKWLQEHKESNKGDYIPASCKKLLPHGDKYYKKALGFTIGKNSTDKKRVCRQKIERIARHEHMTELLCKLDNSCLWEQVKSIEPVGVRPTYDIQVAIDHNFIANSLIIKNSGKSEFIDEMVVRLNIRYGWKAAFFSPENLPMKYHASKLIEKLTGKKFSEATMGAQEYENAKHYYAANFCHILPEERYTLEAILDKAKFLVRRKGIKVLVIDPYNRIESDMGRESETNYISKILDQLTNFAQRNDVLVCLMAHPRKINKSENADGIPTFYDINGSANFYNKADFGLIVHRNRDEGYTLVRVAKVKFRHLGENGDAFFKYNTENGRYVPFADGQPCVFDNRSFLYDDSSQPQAQQQPIPPESNYDFLSDVGDDCPF